MQSRRVWSRKEKAVKKQISSDFNTRQYMQPVDFELFYYNDTTQKPVDAHEHNYCEFYFFLEGHVRYHVGGKSYCLEYGDCLLIPPSTPHYPEFLSPDKPYRRFVFWLAEEYHQKLRRTDPELAYGFDYAGAHQSYRFHTDTITTQEIQGRLTDLIEESAGGRPFHRLTAGLMAVSFLVYVNRLFYESLHQQSAVYENALYLNICGYINSHLEHDLSLDALSSFFYVSKYHISHIFKDNMGISLHQYIMKKRLHASKNAILSHQPISRIFHQYGFKDYTSFFRAFKKEYGLSPREYRDQHRLIEHQDYTV